MVIACFNLYSILHNGLIGMHLRHNRQTQIQSAQRFGNQGRNIRRFFKAGLQIRGNVQLGLDVIRCDLIKSWFLMQF
jgi:hypothetical protein